MEGNNNRHGIAASMEGDAVSIHRGVDIMKLAQASRLSQAIPDIQSSHVTLQRDDGIDTFLTRPPVAQHEIDAVRESVEIALDEALRKVEEGRKQAFDDHVMQELMSSKVFESMSAKEEEHRRALEDAEVQGNPRDYQTALFEVAKKRNTIINLGTGKGKTLIALLTIQHFAPAFDQGKQTLFMVPSVPLCIQQSTTLQANLPYKIKVACINVSHSESTRKELAEANIIVATHGAIHDMLMHYGDMFQMERFNLIVLDECHYASGNHQYKIIMEKFYHALPKEKRPHVLGLTASPILNVKHTHDDSQLGAMLTALETAMDSKLVSLGGLGIIDTTLIHHHAEEKQVFFHTVGVPDDFPSHEHVGLHKARLREFQQLNHVFQDLGPLPCSVYCTALVQEVSRNVYEQESMQQFRAVVAHLQAIISCCNQHTATCPYEGRSEKLLKLERLLEDQIEHRAGDDTVGLVFVERRITAMALHNFLLHRQLALDADAWQRASDMFHPSCDDVRTPMSPSSSATSVQSDIRSVHSNEILDSSPLYLSAGGSLRLVSSDFDQFEDADEPGLEGIFFGSGMAVPPVVKECEQADGACSIVSGQFSDADEEFEQNDIAKREIVDKIRCGVLVRQSTQIFKYLNVEHKRNLEEGGEGNERAWLHQEMNVRNILSSLRRREINLLIATSVVEEGVDVQACSFVIVFDRLQSTKGYVQMKGRARRKDAKFFVFENQADWCSGKNKKISLTSAQQAEIRVQDVIDNRELLLNEGVVFDTRLSHTSSAALDDEIRAVEEGEYKTSHGVVDLRSGKSLLNKYILNMPLDGSARETREKFLLHLPTFEEFKLILSSHLPVDVRIVELPQVYRAFTQKEERQQIMALMACVRLHKLNLLNERLLPLTRSDLCERLITMSQTEGSPILKTTITVSSIFASGAKEIFAYPIVQSGIKASAWRKSLNGDSCSLALLSTETMNQIPMDKYHHPELGEIIIHVGCERKQTVTREQWDLCANFFAALLSSRWGKKSKVQFFLPRSVSDEQELLSPYTLGLVNITGEMDWEHMKKINSDNFRNDEQLLTAVHSTTEAPYQPRLCRTIYNQPMTYIVHGPAGFDCGAPFPDVLDGVETFVDYYKQKWDVQVSAATPLLLAQRLWHLPVKPLVSGSAQPNASSCKKEYIVPQCSPGKTKTILDGLDTVLLPQTVCIEKPLGDVSLSLLTVMLPQFLYHVDRHLIAQAFVRHCTTNLPCLGAYLETLPIAEIIKALTPTRAGLGDSYDQLEWIGDAVLKLLQTDALLHTPGLRLWVRALHEGDLTTLRSAMSNNQFLCEACKRTGIDRFILATPLARGTWIPVNLELHSLGSAEIGLPYDANPGMKVCADVIEAILGMVYLHFGYAAAMSVAEEVRVTLPTDKMTGNQPKAEVKPCHLLLELVTKLTGKTTFNNPALVEEALTHPSAIYQNVPSYQKLEWIGDAVLCMAVREWIYKTYPDAKVGDMVTIEAAVISNEILAYQSVKTGLHRFIRHRDQSLPSRLEHYECSIGDLSRGLWGTDPPKILSDVVESVLGAVHVDGGFTEGQTAALTMMAPILAAVQAIHGNAKMLRHPKAALNEFGGNFLGVHVAREDAFVRSRCVGGPSSSLWQGYRWRKAQLEGIEAVGTVCSMGLHLLSVSEPTKKAARNRACALVVAVLEANSSLSERLREVSRIVQGGHPTKVDDNESE